MGIQMIAFFNFSLSNFVYNIDDKGQNWYGPCTCEFVDASPDDFPLRGDVTFLNQHPAQLTIRLRKNGALNLTHMVAGFDEQVEAWRAKGYPCNSDAYVMRYWPNREDVAAFLGISVALEEPKFSYFQQFMERHIGRDDMSGQLRCDFYGFHEPYFEMPNLPTEEDFLKGSPYFVTGENTIAFFTKPRSAALAAT
jgi:hypothetical protein